MKGIIFDIKQLAVFDGPGIRTTVFLKGCPLRCAWCHNPEGQNARPELMASRNGCLKCGRCKAVCEHPDGCIACGRCVRACPLHLRKIAGQEIEADALAEKLLRDRAVLEKNGGGITLSGGEPAYQIDFAEELLSLLSPVHRAAETCGMCAEGVFARLIRHTDFVMMDLKLIDDAAHRKWTGGSNAPVLRNYGLLRGSGIPHVIRTPLIPGVTDTEANLDGIAETVAGDPSLTYVELLPYQKTAGAKYAMLGRPYAPGFSEEQAVMLRMELFEERGIPVRVL